MNAPWAASNGVDNNLGARSDFVALTASIGDNAHLFLMGGLDGDGSVRNDVYMYEPVFESWTNASDMPVGVHRYGAAVLSSGFGDSIYIVGGLSLPDNGTAYPGFAAAQADANLVQVYNVSADTWSTSVARIPTPTTDLACAAGGGRVYCMGGYDSVFNVLDTLLEYNPSTDAWTTKASLPIGRGDLTAAFLNGGIFVVGGWRTDDGWSTLYTLKSVDFYNPATNTWSSKAALSQARGDLALTVANGQLFAIGGEIYDAKHDLGQYGIWEHKKPVHTLEIYNPATNTWSVSSPLPTARFRFSAAAYGSQVYTFGGHDQRQSALSVMEAYLQDGGVHQQVYVWQKQ